MKNEIINIGILAHVDAGKTTMVEQILNHTGVTQQIGRVDHGSSVTDDSFIERQRGISINSTTISCNWKGLKINIIDTPGHRDFIGEVNRVFGVLDMAVLVVSAKEGVQSQTLAIFQSLVENNIPTIIFINKIDREGADISKTIANISTILSPHVHVLQSINLQSGEEPRIINQSIKKQFYEIVECQEELLSLYVENKINPGNLHKKYIELFLENLIFPICVGSALRGIGVSNLLDIIYYLVSLFPIKQETSLLSAHVYSMKREESGKKHTYFKVHTGVVTERTTYSCSSNPNNKKKITQLFCLQEGRILPAASITRGDIGVLINNNDFQIGDFLGEKNNLSPINQGITILPIEAGIIFKKENTRQDTLKALRDIREEKPDIQFYINETSNEVIVQIAGTVQLEVLKELLSTRYKLELDFKESDIIYKETPKQEASAIVRMTHGVNPFNASIGIKIRPGKRGSGISFASDVSKGYLVASYQKAVEEGVIKACQFGLFGWNVTDIEVLFYEGWYDSVSSSPSDFRSLSPYVLRVALERAGIIVLEPYNLLKINIPIEFMGKVESDLMKRNGKIVHMERVGKNNVLIRAIAPYRTSANYIQHLMSSTMGLGVCSAQVNEYRPVIGASYQENKNPPVIYDSSLLYQFRRIDEGC